MSALEARDCGCGSGQPGANGRGACDVSLPDDPACAVNYHFGMLLGVEDLRAEQGFHVAHARRHQRTLHGFGVVWGLGVSYMAERDELRVAPGLAVDPLGRDLALDALQCLSLKAWWLKHREDEVFAGLADPRDVTFDADVVLCYRNCLSRPVPAIADRCSSGTSDIAHARICETVGLSLVPRLPGAPTPVPPAPPYHLLRLWLELDPVALDAEGNPLPDDAWLTEKEAEIAALPALDRLAARAALWPAVLARAAAATAAPGVGANEHGQCLAIGELRGLRVQSVNGEDGESVQVTLDPRNVSIDQRASLIATSSLQDALLRSGVAKPASAVGPTLTTLALTPAGDALELGFDQPLAGASVTAAAFAVSQFTATGWQLFALPALPDASGTTPSALTLPLGAVATGERLRLTVRGTGSTPLLGQNLIPAGARDPNGDGLDLTTTLSR